MFFERNVGRRRERVHRKAATGVKPVAKTSSLCSLYLHEALRVFLVFYFFISFFFFFLRAQSPRKSYANVFSISRNKILFSKICTHESLINVCQLSQNSPSLFLFPPPPPSPPFISVSEN
ncbi:hypothetical protein PUN28_017485 [Cardiocondyla obscurior]|uniref:Transmembrane protein n=1 Tax=Cardiocondyla obscurior TaxID=286306 RepID=A0AAW2EJQ9_9HYME